MPARIHFEKQALQLGVKIHDAGSAVFRSASLSDRDGEMGFRPAVGRALARRLPLSTSSASRA